MKRVTINNKTTSNIVVEYIGKNYVVSPGCKTIIEVDEDSDELHIIKQLNRFSKFYIGRYISKEELRKLCIINFIVFIQFDSIFHITSGIKEIDINEKNNHYLMYVIFSYFTMNGKSADSYQYHSEVDKKKFMLLSFIYLIPLVCLDAFLILISVFWIIFEFSMEVFILIFICLVFSVLLKKLINTVYNFKKIEKNTRKIMKDSKQVIVLEDKWNCITYVENT